MHATIDLIPERIRLRRRQLRRYRTYGMLVLAVAGAMGFAGAHAARLAGRVEQLHATADKLHAGTATLKQDSLALSDQLKHTRNLLRETERLSQGHRWSRALSYLAAQVPDAVLLVMVATDPPEPGRASSTRRVANRPGAPQAKTSDGPRALAIRGYAVEHEDLAAFLRKLKEGQVFDSVTLLHSKREPFLAGDGIAFTLTCHW